MSSELDCMEEISERLVNAMRLFPAGTKFIPRPDVYGFLAKPPDGPVVLVSVYDYETAQPHVWRPFVS